MAAAKTRVRGQSKTAWLLGRKNTHTDRRAPARAASSSPPSPRPPRCDDAASGAVEKAQFTLEPATAKMLSIRFNQRQTDTHVTPTLDRLAGKHGDENEDPGLMSDGLESVGSPTTPPAAAVRRAQAASATKRRLSLGSPSPPRRPLGDATNLQKPKPAPEVAPEVELPPVVKQAPAPECRRLGLFGVVALVAFLAFPLMAVPPVQHKAVELRSTPERQVSRNVERPAPPLPPQQKLLPQPIVVKRAPLVAKAGRAFVKALLAPLRLVGAVLRCLFGKACRKTK